MKACPAGLMFILLFVFSISDTTMASTWDLEDVLARTIIVRARVIEVEGTERYSTSIQHIEHVYCGDLPAGVTNFVDSSAAQSSTGGPVWPALQLDQGGIWLLRPFRDGQVYRKGIWELGVRWPVRPDVDDDYQRVRMFAEAMESVWLAETEEERIALLKEYVQSEVPEIAVGSIMILEEGAPNELNELASDMDLLDLPLRTQIAIDTSLAKLRGEQWRTSERRERLIAAWAAQTINDEANAMLILMRVDQAIQRRQIDPVTLFDFLEPIITGELRMIIKGEPHSIEVRTRAVSISRHIIIAPAVSDDVFALLTNLLQGDDKDEARLRVAAAQALRNMSTATPEQLQRLTLLRDHYSRLVVESDRRYAPARVIASALEETVERQCPDDE